MLLRLLFVVTALSGMLVVILGAAGQHISGLTEGADIAGTLFSKAQKYHVWHTLALLFTGMWLQMRLSEKSAGTDKLFWLAAFSFITGIVLFSGNLYLRAFEADFYINMLVPVGGALFIMGWLLLSIGFLLYKPAVNRPE